LAAQFKLEPLGAALGKFRTVNRQKNLLTRFINIEAELPMDRPGRPLEAAEDRHAAGHNFIVTKDVLDEVGAGTRRL